MANTFKAFRRFNHGDAHVTGLNSRVNPRILSYVNTDGLPGKLLAELAERRAVPVKEVFESFEFFERTRRRLRGAHVADLCCGHGLTGLLFALFERSVERVTLLDTAHIPSQQVVYEAVCEVGPWVRDKQIDVLQEQVRGSARFLTPGASVIAIHACGARTDRVIEAAIEVEGPVAVMPCCYATSGSPTKKALVKALGAQVAIDVDRTYRLESAGYEVSWSSIPEVITEMNRIVVGTRRRL